MSGPAPLGLEQTRPDFRCTRPRASPDENAILIWFLEPLRHLILKRAKQDLDTGAEVDPNDVLHKILLSVLAEAMVTHYLVGTGWSFSRWQPRVSGADVDVGLRAPSGAEALVQVKATDQPGRVVGGRVVDGERDEHVVASAEKAAGQLPRAGPEVKLVALCPNRSPLSSPWACLVPHLFGATVGGREVTLPTANLGKFWAPGAFTTRGGRPYTPVWTPTSRARSFAHEAFCSAGFAMRQTPEPLMPP